MHKHTLVCCHKSWQACFSTPPNLPQPAFFCLWAWRDGSEVFTVSMPSFLKMCWWKSPLQPSLFMLKWLPGHCWFSHFQAGKVDLYWSQQRSAHLEGAGNRFSSPFLAFNTKNLEVHCFLQPGLCLWLVLKFILLSNSTSLFLNSNTKKRKKIKINRDDYVEQGISQSFPILMKMRPLLYQKLWVWCWCCWLNLDDPCKAGGCTGASFCPKNGLITL